LNRIYQSYEDKCDLLLFTETTDLILKIVYGLQPEDILLGCTL